MRQDILGIGFDKLTPEQALKASLALIENKGKRCAYIVTPNPEIVYISDRDEKVKDAVNSADLVLADGIGIIYASKILGKQIKSRVTGIGLAGAMMPYMAQKGYKLFLLGAKPGVAQDAAERLREQYPGLLICGVQDGYFDDDQIALEAISRVSPDVVFVCLGAPKQELFMQRNASKVEAGLMLGLGGVLDVFSGRLAKAPAIWSKLGFEWLYRLIRQPSRIKRALRLPAFLLMAVVRRLRGVERRA